MRTNYERSEFLNNNGSGNRIKYMICFRRLCLMPSRPHILLEGRDLITSPICGTVICVDSI